MRKVVSITVIILLFVGYAYAKVYEVKKKAGEYDVEVKIDRNPPIVGNNNISVKIKDATSKYITDAKVRIEYSMPPMPGMPSMNYKTDAELKGNEYVAKMNLSMSGSWNVAIKIIRDSKTSSLKFTVDAK